MTVPDEAPRSELLLYRGEDARTRIEVRLDGEATTLQAGDCMAMTLGAQIAFHNPGAQPARYLLATARGSAPSRSPA